MDYCDSSFVCMSIRCPPCSHFQREHLYTPSLESAAELPPGHSPFTHVLPAIRDNQSSLGPPCSCCHSDCRFKLATTPDPANRHSWDAEVGSRFSANAANEFHETDV